MNPRVCVKRLAVLIFAGLLISGTKVLAQVDPIFCQAKMLMVGMECENYVVMPQPNVLPSPRCCMAVRKVSSSCLCSFVINPVEINLVHVAQYCGTQFTPGTRCGSYKIPPP